MTSKPPYFLLLRDDLELWRRGRELGVLARRPVLVRRVRLLGPPVRIEECRTRMNVSERASPTARASYMRPRERDAPSSAIPLLRVLAARALIIPTAMQQSGTQTAVSTGRVGRSTHRHVRADGGQSGRPVAHSPQNSYVPVVHQLRSLVLRVRGPDSHVPGSHVGLGQGLAEHFSFLCPCARWPPDT